MTPTSLTCPTCGEGDAVLGVIERGTYDGVLYWECESCGTRWHRWPEEHWLRARAEEHVSVTQHRYDPAIARHDAETRAAEETTE
jgi:uncharacterized Zn finger protein